jgi:hypothetical protein
MAVWLDLARLAAVANLLVLAALGGTWLRSYRAHGARHSLMLLIFAAILAVQNTLWLYFYTLHAGYVEWYAAASPDVQVGIMALCGLELLGLAVLASLTLR